MDFGPVWGSIVVYFVCMYVCTLYKYVQYVQYVQYAYDT